MKKSKCLVKEIDINENTIAEILDSVTNLVSVKVTDDRLNQTDKLIIKQYYFANLYKDYNLIILKEEIYNAFLNAGLVLHRSKYSNCL